MENSLFNAHNSIDSLEPLESLERGTLVIFYDLMMDKAAIKRDWEFFVGRQPLGMGIIFFIQSNYEMPRRQ